MQQGATLQADYLAKPRPLHWGDFQGDGFSTIYQTGAGYARLQGGRADPTGAAVGAAQPVSAPLPANWLQTAGAGALILVLVMLYLDGHLLR